jgi:carboxylesterase
MKPSWYQNPHLEGGPFFWKGNQTGILLCHGFTATTAEIRLLAQQLHQQGFTVSGVLLPGHGTTVEEMNRCKWQDWTRAMETVYQQLVNTCQTIYVGGESMGAILALWLASQHPEIKAVLTYAPALRVPRLKKAVWLSYFANVHDKPVVDDGLPWQGYTVYPLKAARQFYRLQREVTQKLPTIHQPILIVQGRKDKTIDPGCGQIIQKQTGNPLTELHWLEDSPHVLLLDHELDQAVQLTLSFIHKTSANSS